MKNFKNIDLFIFDMDGLVFETEKLYLKFIPEVLKEKGYIPNDDIIHNSIGMTTKNTEILYKSHFGDDFPFSYFTEKIYEKLLDYNKKNGLELCNGVLEVLEYLNKHGKKCVIASSSDAYIIKEYLKKNNLSKYFIDITAGNEVTHGKPDPEIFLLASKKQNVDPKNCIVFEDSYNGVRAAKNANMKAIMIPNVQKPTDEMKEISTLILNSIKEILMYL